MSRRGRAWVAAVALLVIGGGCARTLRATSLRLSKEAPPLPTVSFGQVGVSLAIARDPYVRVQERPGLGARFLSHLPAIGPMFENYGDAGVVTLDFHDAFAAKARTFLDQLCPGCTFGRPGGSDTPLRIEVQLTRTGYHRTRRELKQTLLLRVTGRQGTVLYTKPVFPAAQGDVLTDPSLIDRTMNEGFRQLADALMADWERIERNLAVNAQRIEDLESSLLVRARALGRVHADDQAARSRRLAVVIGVSRYHAGGIQQLDGAANDAVSLFHTLNAVENHLHFSADQVVLLLDNAATAGNIREALSRWLLHASGPEDTVLVYFSGHGTYSEDLSDEHGIRKEKFFLPVDYDPTHPPDETAIPMQEIISYFDQLSAENVVMVFDACHAGAAERDDRTDELHRFATVAAHNRLNAVIAAAKPEQRSWELRDEDQGLFTRELVDGLRGQADADASGAVTIAELARFLESRVRQESVMRGYLPQEPVWRTNHVDRAEVLPLAGFGP